MNPLNILEIMSVLLGEDIELFSEIRSGVQL